MKFRLISTAIALAKIQRVVLLCLLVFLINTTGWGQIIITDQPPYLSHKTLQAMVRQTDSVIQHIWTDTVISTRADILKDEQGVYLCPDGHFDVYVWENDSWKNLHKGTGFGWNFGAKKFMYNNSIYSYGGYGFWKEHGEVIRFDKEKGVWELLPYTKNLRSGLASFSGHTLHVYGTESYYIDLKNEKVLAIKKVLSTVSTEKSRNISTLQLANYTMDARRSILIDEKNHSIYSSRSISEFIIKNHWYDKSNIWLVTGDSVSLYKRPFEFVKGFQIVNMIDQLGLENDQMPESNSIRFLMIGGTVSVLFFLFWFGMNKRRKNIEKRVPSEENNLNQIIETLLRANQKILTSEELEKVFQLDAVTSQDTIRYKRAHMIREINYLYQKQTGLELITRRPDPADGRRYIYEINGFEK